jgi:hypothetical protein
MLQRTVFWEIMCHIMRNTMLNSPYLDNRFPIIQRNFFGGGEGVREMGHIRFSQIWFKNASILLIFWLTAGTCCRNLAFFFFFFFPFGNLAN